MNYYFSLDVESIGLHGEAFAVGWSVLDETGEELDNGYVAIDPNLANGSDDDRQWVTENVIPHLPNPNIKDNFLMSPQKDMRELFWDDWMHWQSRGATLWADCSWPVEARFLAACIDDEPEDRKWEGPYPLGEISSILLAAGKDPLANYDRLQSELPKHHPTCDARQSGRLLIEALKELTKK